MDEMKIISGFTTALVSKLLRFALRKKLGYDIHIQLNAIEATIKDGMCPSRKNRHKRS